MALVYSLAKTGRILLEKRLPLCHGSETEKGQARDCPHDETKNTHDANHVSDVPVKFQSVNCISKIEFFRKKKASKVGTVEKIERKTIGPRLGNRDENQAIGIVEYIISKTRQITNEYP